MTEDNRLWTPWPGKQTEFLSASEFEVLFGGAKGPGKSDCLLMGSTRYVDRPRYKALLLRESFPELQELIDRSHRLFPNLPNPPVWNANEKRWRWPSGAVHEFGFCGEVSDVKRYQGREWGYIGFDEIGNLKEERVLDMLIAEIRCPDKSIRRMMRAGANPGGSGHAWIKRRYINVCGKQGERVWRPSDPNLWELTRRYVPARVTDNPVYANDPVYMAQLHGLPEVLKRQLLYGDWDAGFGTALEELDPAVHLVTPFAVPKRWRMFGSFDWGFNHPWSFGVYTINEDGVIYLVSTVDGHREMPNAIAEKITSMVELDRLDYIVAGHDVFAEHLARGGNTPSLDEQFQAYGVRMVRANIDRERGLQNFRYYVAWHGQGPDGADGTPRFKMFDTPSNRRVFEQLQGMIVNPDRVNDVLKVNADPVTGEGGDDHYDQVRYALASRPQASPSGFGDQPVRAFSRASLQFEYEQHRRGKPMPIGGHYPAFMSDTPLGEESPEW